jgi:glutamate:Na+ symporter, ESS family
MELSTFHAFNVAIIVLFVGKLLNRQISFLRNFNIPEPVSGGLLFAIGFSLFYSLSGIEISFNMEARDFLLVYFFTAIGLNARFKMLIQGGKSLIILLFITILYMGLQNVTGVSIASALGLSPYVGLLGGTVSLIGGHGTTIAWAPTFESQYGVANAAEIGIACATFGLVLASLMGGPVARFLINRHSLTSTSTEEAVMVVEEKEENTTKLNYLSILHTLLILNVSVLIGKSFQELLETAGLNLPLFVTCLFTGILFTNLVPNKIRPIPRLFPDLQWPSGSRSLALISDLSLSIFLCMSLMSLKLWVLIDLAGPIGLILAAQFLLAIIVNIFIVFPAMGRDYEAAVISSGFGGISLGSTPTAIVNMTAVTKKYGAAQKAFIVVPLVSAFFIDLVNAAYIQTFLSWLQ